MPHARFLRGRDPVGRAIDGWLEAGLIDEPTAERLRDHESAARPVHTSRLARVAFGLGGLLLAAGIFLFVAANWQEISPWSRFAVVLAMVAALHVGAAFGARFSAALATTLHAAGTAALGAGIFLAGQIFNLQADWPDAILLWALGAALAAALLRDWPQVLWVAILGPAWLCAAWATHFPWYRAPPGAAAESVLPFGLVVLSVAYLAATTRELQPPWRRALAALGAAGLLTNATALVNGGDALRDTMEPLSSSLLAAGWAVAIGLPLVVGWLLRRTAAWPVVIAAALAALVIALDPAVTWQRLCIYLVYAAGSAGLVAWGLADGERLRVNLGVLSFALTVLAFYFADLFDKLGRAAGLMGVGLLCIAGGWLAERSRRRLISRLERGAT
jgi:hypothetical protein